MIEATSENIWYKKKKRRFKFKRFFSIFITLLVLISLYLYYQKAICNQIVNICTDYAYSYSADSVNKAVLNLLREKVIYEDLISVEKNNSGDIILISANSYKVNLISREIAENTKLNLENKLSNGVLVPLFAFTGISLISGYGSPVTVKLTSVSSVVCEFESQFKSAGINQTLHSIFIKVKSKVIIEMPLRKEEVDCQTSVLVGESVLVGKVPDIYLGSNLFG